MSQLRDASSAPPRTPVGQVIPRLLALGHWNDYLTWLQAQPSWEEAYQACENPAWIHRLWRSVGYFFHEWDSDRGRATALLFADLADHAGILLPTMSIARPINRRYAQGERLSLVEMYGGPGSGMGRATLEQRADTIVASWVVEYLNGRTPGHLLPEEHAERLRGACSILRRHLPQPPDLWRDYNAFASASLPPPEVRLPPLGF